MTSCFPKSGGTRFILGDDALINQGKHPVTIDSVKLTGAVNLVRGGAFVSSVPSQGPSTIMGNVIGAALWNFYSNGQRRLWHARTPALNAVVPPTAEGADLNLLVITRAPMQNKKSSAGVEVRYHDATRAFVWHSIVTYRAVPQRSC